MASSSAAELLTGQQIDDLQDEIDLQRILLDSLEGTSSDTPARRNELQQGMRDLQRKLNVAVRGQAAHRGMCSPMSTARRWYAYDLTRVFMKATSYSLDLPSTSTDMSNSQELLLQLHNMPAHQSLLVVAMRARAERPRNAHLVCIMVANLARMGQAFPRAAGPLQVQKTSNGRIRPIS